MIRLSTRICIEHPQITDKHVKREYIKERLALAFRVMAQNGLDEGAAGHLTVRDSLDGSTFWVNPFGVPFDTMTVTDLLRIDHTGAIIEGGRSDQMFYNEAAYVIHAAVHSARPDANAVCHSCVCSCISAFLMSQQTLAIQ